MFQSSISPRKESTSQPLGDNLDEKPFDIRSLGSSELLPTLGALTIHLQNIETKDLIVFFTSTITVIGIAFFANWSILSNITASLILYFNHPLNIGETLRIYDKEFDVEGELIDLSFFFMYVRSKEGFLITIPTSAVLNKTVIIKSNKEV